jgi:PAS domain S-box-containing protein
MWDLNLVDHTAFRSLQHDRIFGYQELQPVWTYEMFLQHVLPVDRSEVNRKFLTATETRSDWDFECRIVWRDGTQRWIRAYGRHDCDEQGVPSRMIGIVKDITERKQAEEERDRLELQMQQAQKLESLGVLAGGIAHDFNNILMAIMGNADLALMRINPESPVVDNLQRIEQAAARAADLAKQMLAYSGKGKFVVEHIDVSRLVEEMHNMMEVSISKRAVFRFNLTRPLPSVEADATQLRQIIMNLVINASEAIGEKSGVIAISTGCMTCDKNYLKSVWLNENLTDGLYVYLDISDTGCGMEAATLTKLFDPFFTTKFTGRGLGMAAVLGIVRGHKGAIRVYSEPGKGSSFKILLPAVDRPAEIFNGAAHVDSWKGEGTVLLVDDEETVRAIGSEMLRELGFQVVTADDGRDALEIFKSRDDISFVILDYTMPHLNGEECFRELRTLKPDVKVIMSSGFNQQEITEKFVGKGLAGFIQKPYRMTVLKEALKDML